MNKQKHIINRQVLELTVPERGRVQFIQNKTSEIVKQKLLPKLDDLFSKLVSADEIIRIDKMVIDLGPISENELESAFVERSVREIGEKINRIIVSRSTKTGKIPVNGHSVKSGEKFITTSKSENLLEQFIFFLQNGYFPWWYKSYGTSSKSGSLIIPVSSTMPVSPTKSGSTAIQPAISVSGTNNLEEIFSDILKCETEILKNAIIPLFRNPSVIQRLIFQFQHSQLESLLVKINKRLIDSYFEIFQLILSSVKSAQKRNDFTDSFYEIVFQYVSFEKELINDGLKIEFLKDILELYAAKHPLGESEKILTEILHSLQLRKSGEISVGNKLVVASVIQVALKLPGQNQHLQEVIRNIPGKKGTVIYNLVEQHIEKTKKEAVNNTTGKNAVTNEKEELKFEGESESFSDESVREAKFENREIDFSLFSSQTTDDTDGIIVNNGGLVLIHPFLRYFFEGLNLLDKELRFKSQSDVFKAVHLLQFIATGEENTRETDLPLNKILCGLDITEPIPANMAISDEEKEECMHLIKTVLERWNALKTSNPDALRETYLQREGILKKSGHAWSLTVERNTFDVMLEKLPWSINLIKLPWLSQILYVEW